MKRKLKTLWQIIWAKHYAILLGDSEAEIGWAIEAIRNADELNKKQR